MGFFSFNCNACQHPLLSHHATNKINNWMRQSVVVFKDGTYASGEYDGYGIIIPDNNVEWRTLRTRLLYQGVPEEQLKEQGLDFNENEEDGVSILRDCPPNTFDDVCVWHKACWEKAGKPTEYLASLHAPCQGYFFGDEHNMPEPEGGA